MYVRWRYPLPAQLSRKNIVPLQKKAVWQCRRSESHSPIYRLGRLWTLRSHKNAMATVVLKVFHETASPEIIHLFTKWNLCGWMEDKYYKYCLIVEQKYSMCCYHSILRLQSRTTFSFVKWDQNCYNLVNPDVFVMFVKPSNRDHGEVKKWNKKKETTNSPVVVCKRNSLFSRFQC